jgi:hypothetical protein
MVGTGQL